MQAISFQALNEGYPDPWINPAHVIYWVEMDTGTLIHLTGGVSLAVTANPVAVSSAFQGLKRQ